MTLLYLVLLAAAALAQQPDRSPLPDEWGYRPAEGASVAVNPPAFSWVLEKGAKSYSVQWASSQNFAGAHTVTDLPWTVYAHNKTLTPGKYFWRYRVDEGPWSRTRSFTVPANAAAFPQPSMEELKPRIPKNHPRLFVHSSDVDRLRIYAKGEGKAAWSKFIAIADALVAAEPTAEPTVMGNSRNPETRDHWWSNRVQAIKALQEAEVLTFAWLMTGDKKYAAPAKRFTLALAAWNPDGPTNFALNCEAAKPMVHRLARAYDWGYDLFSDDERATIRAMLLRRAQDAWKSGEARFGVGHLNQPYVSHANRLWHKLAENAIATLGDTPESDLYLRYAVTKFFTAYPVWSDDDGGWHEGLSYLGGYMVKTRWWMHLATQLGLEPFRNPFFARIGDYALYSAPPGSPEQGFGDLSFRPPSSGWSFLHYFARASSNGAWAWWLDQWKVPDEGGEPVLDFLWSSMRAAPPTAPVGLPVSKHFRGTGVAVLNTDIVDGMRNVQFRFKSSDMGRSSHGHDPQNSFTLNAYGVPLLVNNVYRDLYGSAFHRDWCWSTKSQNAVLVNGEGQKAHSVDAKGHILKAEFQEGFDFVEGDATPAYEGRLTRAKRYVFFVKPDIVIVMDEVAAPKPSTFQFLLHAQQQFALDGIRAVLDRKKAGVAVDYLSSAPLKMKQWTGYEPAPDKQYLDSIKSSGIPEQWHLEASTTELRDSVRVIGVMQVFEQGKQPDTKPSLNGEALSLGDVRVTFSATGATVKRSGKEWAVKYGR